MKFYGKERQTELVKKAKAGDSEAFILLTDKFYPIMKTVCYQIVHDTHAVEDIVQDVMLSVWRRLHALKDEEVFGFWILTIAKRKCFTYLKRMSIRSCVPLSMDPVAAEEKEPYPDLDGMIETLKEPLRSTMRDYYQKGKIIRRISRETGVPEGTIKRRLHMGRKKLKVLVGALLLLIVVCGCQTAETQLRVSIEPYRWEDASVDFIIKGNLMEEGRCLQ